MPEQPAPGIKHEAIEADIERLAKEVSRMRELPERRGAGERELLKQSLRAITPAAPPQKKDESSSPLPAYAQGAPAETKLEIEYLLDLAFHKGIAAANAEAMKSNPFVLDAFHDALAGKLYPELQRRGILK